MRFYMFHRTNYTGLSTHAKCSCNYWHNWPFLEDDKEVIVRGFIRQLQQVKTSAFLFRYVFGTSGNRKGVELLAYLTDAMQFCADQGSESWGKQWRRMPSLSSEKESLQLLCWKVNRRGDSLHIKTNSNAPDIPWTITSNHTWHEKVQISI